MNEIHLIICCLLIIPVHEVGHYLAARKQGIYKGWGLLPNPHIKLTKPYGSRWGYLSGFAASLFLFPYWALTQNFETWILFLGLCLSGASFDIPVVILHGRLLERRRRKKK